MAKIIVTYRRDKKEVSETLTVQDAVMTAIKSGMQQADKLGQHWKDNCEIIVGQFWPSVVIGDGQTKSAIIKTLRDSEPNYSQAFAVFTQTSRHWELGEKFGTAVMAKSEPKSAEYDSAKRTRDVHRSDARTTASQQLASVLRHFAALRTDDTATGESREQLGARQIMEAAIVEWASKVEAKKGAFSLTAERALLQAGVDALRAVLTANPANIVSREAAPAASEVKPEYKGKTLTADEYNAAIAAESTAPDGLPNPSNKLTRVKKDGTKVQA